MLEPQDFRDVLVIARERSLKAAAGVLGIDPSTMGRRLEGLETRFGAKLFLRLPRGFEVTPEGQAVVDTAQKLEALQLGFERDVLAARPSSGALTITCAEWGVPLLTPIAADLARRHPDIPLRLRIENRTLDLTRREADVALRIGRPREEALVGRPLGVVTYALYGSPAYLAQAPSLRSAADLSRHTFVSLDQSFERQENARWQAQMAGGARVLLHSNSLLSLVEAARAGAGLTTLPCALGDRDADLRRALPELATTTRDLWLVFHRDLKKSRPLRVVIDALVTRIKPLFAPPKARPRART